MRARHVLGPLLLLAVAALLLFLLLSPGGPESEETARGTEAAERSGLRDATLVGTGEATTPAPAAPLVEPAPLEMPAPGGPGRCSLYGTVTRGRSPCAATIEVRRLADVPRTGTAWQLYLAECAGHLAGLRAGEPLARAEAGEDGAYDIRGLSVGRYEVQARRAEGADTRREIGLSPEGRRERLDLAVPNGRSTLRGRLLRADGTPWVGSVLLEPQTDAHDTPWSVARTVDAEGRFTIPGLPPGPLAACAVQAGTRFVARHRGLIVPYEGEWTWVVDRGIEVLEARVVDAVDGTPVGGAVWLAFSVRPASHLFASGRADAEGRCRIPLVEGADVSTFAAGAPGYAPGDVSMPWEEPLVLRLARAARVEGRVTDAGTGDPVRGARVCFVAKDWPGRASATTDGEGRYALDGLPSGRYLLYALGSGWVSAEIDDGVRAAAEGLTVHLESGRTTRCDLQVRKAPRILGRVRDATGTPVTGARVQASLHARQSPQVAVQLAQLGAAGYGELRLAVREQLTVETTSGEDGVFVLDGLTPGLAYAVRATAPDQAAVESERVVVKATGIQRLDLAFPPPRWLEVTVLDAWSGEPVAGASVDGSGGGLWLDATTDARGRGRLGPLGGETPSLSIEAEGYQGREDIAIEDGAGEVEIRLERGFVMTGRVLLPDGSPMANRWVEITRLSDSGEASRQYVFALTDEAGRFETHSLWPGRYVVAGQDRWIEPTAVGSVEAAAGDEDVLLRLEKR